MATNEQTVHFNINTFESDEPDPGPFRVVLEKDGDRLVEFANPRDLDWRLLEQIERPSQLIKHCLSDEDRKYVMRLPLNARELDGLFNAWKSHYNVGSLGNGLA